MEYEKIETIKKELENKEEVSLVMLQELQAHINKLIQDWGTKSGEKYRII